MARARTHQTRVRHLTLLACGRGRVDFFQVRGVRSLIIDRAPHNDELTAQPELQRLIVVSPEPV